MENKDIEKVGKSILNKLMSGDAKESSKRALAIYIVVVLGTIITCYSLYKGVDYIILLGVWLSFAGTLLGYSEYNKNRKLKHDADVEKETLRNERLNKEDELEAKSDESKSGE